MSLLSRSRRLPPQEPSDLDLTDIQGNTVLGYYLPATHYLFLTVADPAGARRWLADLAPQLRMSHEPRTQGVALNLAITARGLHALGVPTRLLARLPTAFRVGMAARAQLLGDPVDAAGHPIGWDAPFGGDPLHLMLMVSGEKVEVAARIAQLRSDCWQDGICELAEPLESHRLPEDLEHFGYRDGLSGPLIRELSAGIESSRPRIPAGEFILGMPAADERRDLTEPWLTRNGSYLALRKLEQDVAGFRAMLRRVAQARGLSPTEVDVVAAKLMGRHPDGRPITTSPTTAGLTELSDSSVPEHPGRSTRILSNDFDYSGDDGSGCPVGSHVRRANPRGSLQFDGQLEMRHQLIRRGLPYGPKYSDQPDDPATRGLVFACYQADLAAQFEFVQSQWLNDGNAFGLGAECDPIAGMTSRTAGPFSFGGPVGRTAVPTEQIARYITTRGGEYFLVPGRRSLLNLSALAPDEDGIRLWARCSS